VLRLDQFFTKQCVAMSCWRSLCPILSRLTAKRLDELYFIEPSVGDGAFYDLLPLANRIGLDIEPRRADFLGQDFLTWSHHPDNYQQKDIVVIGNPPFGKRANMAVKFLNKASTIADTVAFIVPVIFRKYLIHKLIDPSMRWIYSTSLPREAFWTDKKDIYGVNTEFQIWTRLASRHKNKRLFAPPPIRHKDFDMWQYNNTKGALKVFENPFDFAVPSQGWQDYNRRETQPNKCEKHKQWLLFKAADEIVRARLYEGIDYEALAMKNTTSIPGFRKGDLVQEYSSLYG